MSKSITLRALLGALLTAGAVGVACSNHTRDEDTAVTQPLGRSTAELPDDPSARIAPPAEGVPLENSVPLSPGAAGTSPAAPAAPAPSGQQQPGTTPTTSTPVTTSPVTTTPITTSPSPTAPTPAPTTPTPAPPPTDPGLPPPSNPAPTPPAPAPLPNPTPMPAPTTPPSMVPMHAGPGAAFGGARTAPMQAQPIRGDAGVPITPPPRDAGAGGGARDGGVGGGARDAGTGGTRGDAGVGTAPRGDGGIR